MREWKKLMRDCESLWDIPICGGAIDGKHVHILCPKRIRMIIINTRKATV
jgi:hypothetical protein